MLPRLGTSKFVSTWLVVTLTLSVIAMVDGGLLWSWLAFSPSAVWQGEVWRLVTWIAIEPSPMMLVVTLGSIYKFGGELAPRWGDRRLRRYVFDVLVGSAVITAMLALVIDGVWPIYCDGGWSVGDVLVIAWARQFPTSELTIYSAVTVRGPQLVFATIGVTVLFALAAGIWSWMPELLACAAAALYPLSRLRQ